MSVSWAYHSKPRARADEGGSSEGGWGAWRVGGPPEESVLQLGVAAGGPVAAAAAATGDADGGPAGAAAAAAAAAAATATAAGDADGRAAGSPALGGHGFLGQAGLRVHLTQVSDEGGGVGADEVTQAADVWLVLCR